MSTPLPAAAPLPFATLAEWQDAYAGGADPGTLLAALLAWLPADDPAWISRIDEAALARRCWALQAMPPTARGRLWGVPFAVKDNIDAAGLATTCACPEFAYEPAASAAAVARLEQAGAVVIGKTNLDQFATGLVGTRSPYGVVPNSFDARYICGGSSSGSASVVARGLVPFALGTDTAGSGRVPAGHNNLVGLKPTRGLVPASGLVPACRTLDCISIFALGIDDAAAVLQVMAGYAAEDPYSRHAVQAAAPWPDKPVLGIPKRTEWHGDHAAEAVHARALDQLASLGATLVEIDFAVLDETAALLYDGPWVAERYAAIESLMQSRPEAVHPVVRGVIEKAAGYDAVAAFKGAYRLAELQRAATALMAPLDGLLVPTAPGLPTIEAVLADPVGLNTRMGRYTNFVNLLDWSALALPAGMRSDGLPAGITLIAPAWHEPRLLEFGRRWQAAQPWRRGASALALAPPAEVASATGAPGLSALPASAAAEPVDATRITVAVVGAHLSGMPLNGQLTERGATLVGPARTSAAYRLYALPGTVPAKPGLLRTGSGAPIDVELWSMPLAHYGSFVALIGSPLGIGSLELDDGRRVQGFVCEAWATEGARDITELGGWRAWVTHQKAAAPG